MVRRGAGGLRNAVAVRHSDAGIISDWTLTMTCKPFLLAALLLGLVTAASAQRDRREPRRQQEQPELFQALVRCRAITEDSATQLAALDANPVTVKVVAGVLVMIMMLTTFMTSRQMILKTGWAEDPQQKMIQRLMLYGIPLSLLVSGALFPIGVVIYWVTNNLFSLAQQQWVLRKFPPPKMASGKDASSSARPAGASGATSATKGAQNPVRNGRTGGLFGRKDRE